MAKTRPTPTRRGATVSAALSDPPLRPVAGAEEPPLMGPPSEAATDGDRVERISIPLTADGNAIDWERMRPKTQDQLRSLLGTGPAVNAAPLDPAVAGMLFGSLGMLMVSIARAKGYTDDQARVLLFSPEERAALAEPTGKLFAKYAGALGRWQEETMFLVMFGTVMAGKLSALRKTAPVINMVREEPVTEEPIP